jgi:hypothetical protein
MTKTLGDAVQGYVKVENGGTWLEIFLKFY